METVTDFIFLGSKITADGDSSCEIKRCLFLGRNVMTNLDSILKSRDIILPAKVHLIKAMVFPVVMYEWRRKWQLTPVFLPRESHEQRSLVGCCPWGCTKLDTTEATSHACMHLLEKETAAHSSILAWRIPGMEDPGWLPSIGLHRVGHN